jgi:feruloyl-CoA hydratase/lyase
LLAVEASPDAAIACATNDRAAAKQRQLMKSSSMDEEFSSPPFSSAPHAQRPLAALIASRVRAGKGVFVIDELDEFFSVASIGAPRRYFPRLRDQEERTMPEAKKHVKVEKYDGISWVYLNRPEKRNAMSPALHVEMDAMLEELEGDPDTKVVVLRGAGGNFSAGQDLKEFFRALEGNPAEAKRMQAVANNWRWDRLYNYDKPTICMIEGYCVGGAFMQLLATDFALAADNAVFSLSEVNWGILPGALVSKVVVDAVLYRHALYYACLGEAFDGREAARVGFINYAVPADKLEKEVEKLAEKLMAKSPAVLRATKQAIRQVRTMDFGQAYDYLAAKNAAIRVNDPEQSYATGLSQFIDKKSYKPVYQPFKLGTLLTDGRLK